MNLEDIIERRQAEVAGTTVQTLRKRQRCERLRSGLSVENVLGTLFVILALAWVGIQC